MCPDSLPRLWRYINLLLTYLLTYNWLTNSHWCELQACKPACVGCFLSRLFTFHHRSVMTSGNIIMGGVSLLGRFMAKVSTKRWSACKVCGACWWAVHSMGDPLQRCRSHYVDQRMHAEMQVVSSLHSQRLRQLEGRMLGVGMLLTNSNCRRQCDCGWLMHGVKWLGYHNEISACRRWNRSSPAVDNTNLIAGHDKINIFVPVVMCFVGRWTNQVILRCKCNNVQFHLSSALLSSTYILLCTRNNAIEFNKIY